MSLNEQVAREVMGWPVAESMYHHYSNKPDKCCFTDGNAVLQGIPYRAGLGTERWDISWKEWRPDENIAQAFEVVSEVLSWEWDNSVWFVMTIDDKNRNVYLLNRFEYVAEESGESLPEVICQVALWAWRCGAPERKAEDA